MKSTKDDKTGLAKWAYYSGMGFQMIAVIGVFIFIGNYLDKNNGNEKPIFTALLGLLGVGVSLYQVIRSLTKKKES